MPLLLIVSVLEYFETILVGGRPMTFWVHREIRGTVGNFNDTPNRLTTQWIVRTRCVFGIYVLDVLWGQPIKLAREASTSELLEN